MLRTLILAVVLSLGTTSYSQNSPTHFIEFIVDGPATIDQLRAVDTHMRAQQDIIMSRMDIPTRRYYVVFNENPTYTEQWFASTFGQLGNFTIHCFFHGIKGQDDFRPITHESCNELN